MIAEIDIGTATLVAAVVVLIGTFVANTYTTIRQERAQRFAQVVRTWQLHKALYSEIGFVVTRFCNIMGSPEDDLVSLWRSLQGIDIEVYESIHEDIALFYGLEDANRIDRFYKWVSSAVSLGKSYCLKEELTMQPGQQIAKDAVIAANVKALLKRHLKNALKALDLSEVMAEATYVFIQEGSVGNDPRDFIFELATEPVPESVKLELRLDMDNLKKQLELAGVLPAQRVGFWARLFGGGRRKDE